MRIVEEAKTGQKLVLELKSPQLEAFSREHSARCKTQLKMIAKTSRPGYCSIIWMGLVGLTADGKK
jgi:hypothetical protein